jgi:trehalose-6-phosphate synthase
MLADEINARHGDGSYRPILLIVRHYEQHEIFELFARRIYASSPASMTA